MEKKLIVEEILKDIEQELEDEQLLEVLFNTIVSEKEPELSETFGQKMADIVAKGAGSWAFILGFIVLLSLWIIYNNLVYPESFDPFPYILLNLILSCVAALQAPLIMMSQNRREEKDRTRSINDYKVNLKTEIIIESLFNEIQEIKKQQIVLLHYLNDERPLTRNKK